MTFLFRHYCGALDESMRTVVEVKDMQELSRIVGVPADKITCQHYTYDERIDWDTWIIRSDRVLGFTNGSVPDQPPSWSDTNLLTSEQITAADQLLKTLTPRQQVDLMIYITGSMGSAGLIPKLDARKMIDRMKIFWYDAGKTEGQRDDSRNTDRD